MITDDAPDSVAVDLRPADVYIPPGVDAIVRDVQPRSFVLLFDVTTTRKVPVSSAVRVVVDSGVGGGRSRLTRMVPDSVLVTGPRRAVEDGRIGQYGGTDRDRAGQRSIFCIPLDMKRLATGVRVKPSEVRLLVQMPPLTRRARSAALLTSSKPR